MLPSDDHTNSSQSDTLQVKYPILVKSTSTPKEILPYFNTPLILSHPFHTPSKGMTMKIPINLLKTCPINSEIYRDSDVGDLVNSISEVGLLQQSK